MFIVILKFGICLLIDTRSKHILNSAVFHKNTWRVLKELDKKPLVSEIVSFAVLQFCGLPINKLHKPKPNGQWPIFWDKLWKFLQIYRYILYTVYLYEYFYNVNLNTFILSTSTFAPFILCSYNSSSLSVTFSEEE